ncbi:MAG TPA: alpha/beta hydrolase [Chloroflexota bacterium]|jgi:pimeloyl-ACP methyl ester carboxylesterase|nr:alpha/beta hydrolase [Chloroflexota bacterium]
MKDRPAGERLLLAFARTPELPEEIGGQQPKTLRASVLSTSYRPMGADGSPQRAEDRHSDAFSGATITVRKENGRRYPHLERAMPRLAPRPLLMIHGGGDTYIKPGMAQQLFARARQPKELWLVEKAKHNQALQVAGDQYRQRVLAFFETHLTTEGSSGSRRQPS